MAVLLRELTGQAVLLVDLSTERGAVSVHLNLAPKLTLADLPADPVMIDADVIGSLITNHSSGVDVLTAPPSPQSAELVTPSAIASILPVVRGWYKWIIIDTSATFSELNLGVFDQSDLLMLVCAPDLASLKVTQATLDILAALQMPADKRVLVLNNTTPRFRLPRDEIERTLGERIGLFVPHSEEVLDSIDRGVPIALGSRDEPVVEAVCSFAAQLAQVKREAEVQARRGGLGGWVQSIVSSLRR
jgi:pilus assembly protein CpaE